MTNQNQIIIAAAISCATECWEQNNSDQQAELARDTQTGNFARSTDALPMQGDIDYAEEELGRAMTDEQSSEFSGTYLAHLEELAEAHYVNAVKGEDEAYAAEHGIEMHDVSFHRA